MLESENCTHILICDGIFSTKDEIRMAPLKEYVFIFGGTSKGHLLVFGKSGIIVDRYQLHESAFTQMVFDEKTQCLFTSCIGWITFNFR